MIFYYIVTKMLNLIKFKAKLTINGQDILDDHKVDELEKKYEQKLKK